MAFALLSSPLYAADGADVLSAVQVRGSDKSDYSRIVFDWGNTPHYTARATENGLTIKFDHGANFKVSGASPETLKRVAGYKIISPDTVQIDFADGGSARHFVTDNRLIIDIRGGAAKEAAKETTKETAAPLPLTEKIEDKKPEEKKAEERKKKIDDVVSAAGHDVAPTAAVNAPSAKAEGDAEKESAPKEESAAAESIVTNLPSAEEKAVEKKPEQPPVIISITSTESIALAVFERNGYLWIAEDKEGIKLPPSIGGEGAKQLQPFETVPATGMTVFRLKLPQGKIVDATGGGLVWKLSLGSEGHAARQSVPMKRLYGDAAGSQGGPSILWPAKQAKRVAELTDPDTGDVLQIIPVEDAADFAGEPKNYVDFDILPSYIGLALLPKSDELKTSKTPEGILLAKPEGLFISPERDVLNTEKVTPPAATKTADNQEISRIYDFAHWQVGTKPELSSNQRLIMASMAGLTDAKKTESLINLARLSLSFNYAPEALGYLDLAIARVPDLDSNPEFISLRGAAEVLSWKYKDAFADFSAAGLNDIGEIQYWKAFALAKLDDWQQAAKILPNDLTILSTYPDAVKEPFSLVLAEIALREGNAKKARQILDVLEPLRKGMELPYASAFDYLKGEYDRQTGKAEEAKKIWEELSGGKDDLYRAKARFALTMLQLGAKEITAEKAIDNLEGLRYAWRGDDLEVSINYNLAKAYLEKGEPVKSLNMMKLARDLNPESEQGKKINADMHAIFKELFAPQRLKNLTPLDALTVYNDFSDLMPPGEEGEILGRQLADRLAEVDLLPRAADMLKKQIAGGLQGEKGAAVAIRLATLQNKDDKPDDALQSLDKADEFLKGLSPEIVVPRQRDIGLLRAKALSMKGKTDDSFAALALLSQDEDTLRLRADIAWRAKKWQDAADSLEQLIQKQDISLTRPLDEGQADLILNWAVALYLADNRYVLANVRERYADAMAATSKAQKFDVVTRPRQAALLSDRDTINTIVDETVIFKDFLKTFKVTDVPASSVSDAAQKIVSPLPAATAAPQGAEPPPELRNAPGLKTDEVLGD